MSRRNLIGLRRCSTIRATSPNHEGVEGTDRDVVWMLTDASAILFMCASLMEVVLFFLLKKAHFIPVRYRLHLVAHPVGDAGHSMGFVITAVELHTNPADPHHPAQILHPLFV